jgi:hypothetical protein
MIKVTLDTNVIIKATKSDEIDYDLALRLLDLHKQNVIRLQVAAANASENNRSMTGTNQSLFGDLILLGIPHGDMKILPTPIIIGMAHLDHCYLPIDETANLKENIWHTIYPSIPMEHQDFCNYKQISLDKDDHDFINNRWRNHICDVTTVFEYIRDCQDNTDCNDICILVTADDDDMLKHVKQLQKLGAKQILGLKDALNEIEHLITDQ